MGKFWGIVFGLMLISFGVGAIAGVNVWKYFFPIIFILIGISILFNLNRKSPDWHEASKPTATNEGLIDYSVTFSGINKEIVTDNFQGGKVSLVFGGATLDLSRAQIAKNGVATLKVDAVFGGVKIIVPSTWKVEGDLAGVFGGFNNSAEAPEQPKGTLFIKGSAVFGGGEIVN